MADPILSPGGAAGFVATVRIIYPGRKIRLSSKYLRKWIKKSGIPRVAL